MAGTNLGTAYVSIMPSAKGIKGSISKVLDGESKSAGLSAGNNIVGALKGVIAGAAIGKFFKDALDAGGAMQQSFGGLDTIYGDAADGMKDLAYEAAKAGISANSYAEQAVSFGASLRQAFGGDLTKAAESANTAILDMADNSAKMGTDITAIQNAYQGFARGNYVMLDNLRLGYGGTKTEMERLLKDAQALTGVKYNIDNLGDVYAAIHAIQGELGITGVAAAEAEGTFTGSFGSMKAAWDNLKADLALGNDITEDLQVVFKSAGNFLTNNLLPMIGNVLKGIPGLVAGFLTNAFQNLPGAVDSAINFINGLIEGIQNNSGAFFEGIANLWDAAMTALTETDWAGLAGSLITLLWEGLKAAAPAIWEGLKGIGESAAEWFQSIDWASVGSTVIHAIGTAIGNLGNLIWEALAAVGNYAKEKFGEIDWSTAGSDALHALIDGLSAIGELLWEAIKGIAETAAETFTHGDTDWAQVGQDILEAIGHGIGAAIHFIVEGISELASAGAEAFKNIDWAQAGQDAVYAIIDGIEWIGTHLWAALKTIGRSAWEGFRDINWREVGENVINFIKNGIEGIGTFIGSALATVGSEAWDAFVNLEWVQAGIDIVNGIIDGIKQFGHKIGETISGFATGALDKVKNVLGISSPSKVFRDQVGKWIPLGIAEGILSQAGSEQDAIDNIAGSAVDNAGNIPISVNGFARAAETVGHNIVNYFNISGAENPEDFAVRVSRQLRMEMELA